MKNLLLALALVAGTASAQTTAFGAYDFGSRAGPKGTQQELAVGLSQVTSLGTFDAAFVGNDYRLTGKEDKALGFEVGYSNGLKLASGNLTGRVGYGRKNQIDPAGGAFLSNVQYYSLGAEFTAPFTKDIGVYANYRHRQDLNASADLASNRYGVGADVRLTSNAAVRLGYSYTVEAGKIFNGVSTAVSYKF